MGKVDTRVKYHVENNLYMALTTCSCFSVRQATEVLGGYVSYYERPGSSFHGNSREIYEYTFPWYFYWYSYQFTCYRGRNSTVVEWKFTPNSIEIPRKFPWKFCINSMEFLQNFHGFFTEFPLKFPLNWKWIWGYFAPVTYKIIRISIEITRK